MDESVIAILSGVVTAALLAVGKVSVDAYKRGAEKRSIAPGKSDSGEHRLREIHEIVTARDENGTFRVLNKTHVEQAIIHQDGNIRQILDQLRTQTNLLQQLIDIVAPRRGMLPTNPER